MAIIFKVLRYRNFLSTGNQFTEIDFTRNRTTLIVGENGSGKCLERNTKINININNSEVKKAFEEYINEKNKKNIYKKRKD